MFRILLQPMFTALFKSEYVCVECVFSFRASLTHALEKQLKSTKNIEKFRSFTIVVILYKCMYVIRLYLHYGIIYENIGMYGSVYIAL